MKSMILILAAVAANAQTGVTTPVRCPDSISVVETAQSLPGWKAASITTQHAFERISVYNADTGGREFDLAPDDQKKEGVHTVQTWGLSGYRTMSLFLRCRYRDTEVTLSMELPASLKTCRQTIRLDGKGKIVGKPEMACQ
jgi:hypothetical protein